MVYASEKSTDLPHEGEDDPRHRRYAEDGGVGDLRQGHGPCDLGVGRHGRSADERSEESGQAIPEHRPMQAWLLDEVLTSDIIDDIHVPDMLDHGSDGHRDHEEDGLP